MVEHFWTPLIYYEFKRLKHQVTSRNHKLSLPMIYYTNSVNFYRKNGMFNNCPTKSIFFKINNIIYFLVRYVHLIVKYLSEKYQLVKIKINGVHDCPTLLIKRVQISPSTGSLVNSFKQVLMVGQDKYSGTILNSTKNGTILNTAPDE